MQQHKMNTKNRIIITNNRKNVKTDLPEDLWIDLLGVFIQYGGVNALEKYSGLPRNTISDVKRTQKGTVKTVAKLRKGIAALKKLAA